jgi:hypothetical protein
MNAEDYNRSVRYWSEFFASVLSDGSGYDWQPWLNASYENYSQGDDEIVIFSRYSSSMGKGFSIQQEIQPSSAMPMIKALTRTALAESEKPIAHLVISCTTNKLNEPLLKELLRIWCLSGVSSIHCEVG